MKLHVLIIMLFLQLAHSEEGKDPECHVLTNEEECLSECTKLGCNWCYATSFCAYHPSSPCPNNDNGESNGWVSAKDQDYCSWVKKNEGWFWSVLVTGILFACLGSGILYYHVRNKRAERAFFAANV